MKRPHVWLLLLTTVYLAVAAGVGTGLVDDSYIFLRYARNIVDGHGAVFNPGERVEGYTSPLWLACVTLVSLVSTDPVRLAGYLGGAIGLLTVLLVSRRSQLGALAVAAHPGFVFWSFSGMETPLAALLLTLTMVTLQRDSLSPAACGRAGLAFALACLARPDCLALLPLMLAWMLYRCRSARAGRWHLAAAFVAPLALVGVHAVWRHSYYGVWLPNTAYAKLGSSFGDLIAHGMGYLPSLLLSWSIVLGLQFFSTLERSVFAFAVAAFWSALVVIGGGDFFPFARFGMVVLPVLAALADCGRIRINHALMAAPVAAATLLLLLTNDHELARKELHLVTGWRESGVWLNQHLPKESTIATLVAGSLPYYAQRRTIDLLGLTDAQIGRHGHIETSARVGHQRYDSDYVLSRRPDVIVLQETGRSMGPRFGDDEWPKFTVEEMEYVHAMEDLLRQDLTKRMYEYRPALLPNGTYLEVLWLKR
jgi:hypothetical protein